MQRRKVVKKGRRSLQWLRRRSLWKYKRGDYHQSVVLIANRAGISKWFHPFSLAKKESSFKKKYQFTLPKYQIHPQITNTHPIHTPKYQRDRCLDFQIVFFWLGFRGPLAFDKAKIGSSRDDQSWVLDEHQHLPTSRYSGILFFFVFLIQTRDQQGTLNHFEVPFCVDHYTI